MLRLTVRRTEWLAHIDATAAAYGDALVPVVKGNGYGFGRPLLHRTAAERTGADSVCVGTVAELADVPAGVTPVVLTPTLTLPASTAVLTVGCDDHVAALTGWGGRVMVKLASSMRRYGVDPDNLPSLLDAVRAAGLSVAGFALHLPTTGTDADRADQVRRWLGVLATVDDGEHDLWLSHLDPATLAELAAEWPARRLRIRVGTMMWHGVPRGGFLHLVADVLQVRPVRAGETVGYRDVEVPVDGTLVCVGVGSAHGVRPLDLIDAERRSPFHFERRRLHLVERPHMHTSLCLVPIGDPCPAVGDRVDVQQPLIDVHVDEIEWL